MNRSRAGGGSNLGPNAPDLNGPSNAVVALADPANPNIYALRAVHKYSRAARPMGGTCRPGNVSRLSHTAAARDNAKGFSDDGSVTVVPAGAEAPEKHFTMHLFRLGEAGNNLVSSVDVSMKFGWKTELGAARYIRAVLSQNRRLNERETTHTCMQMMSYPRHDLE